MTTRTDARKCERCGLDFAKGQKSSADCSRCARHRREHGDDKGVVTFIYYSREDSHGRRSFAIWWWMEGFHAGPSWRAQHFFCEPGPRVKEYKEQGLKVRELEEIE